MMKVAVLLSTYNGEKFLQKQLDSLLSQQDVELTVLVRDDGSTDQTLSILDNYIKIHSNIRLTVGENIGVIHSFLTLVEMADDGFDFYALCDQDDVWHENKLQAAIELLQEKNNQQPLLYCSALEYVDADLNHRGHSSTRLCPSFGNALVENIVTGCTAVFNPRLRELIIQYRPHQAAMHDWWMYLLATAFGEVIFDPKCYIKYRQHGGNVVGAKPSFLPLWQRRLRIVLNREVILSIVQVAEFYQYYGDKLKGEKQILIHRFLQRKESLRARWLLFSAVGIIKQTMLETVAVRLLIFLGWY